MRECARVAHSQHAARMGSRLPRRVGARARRRAPRRRRRRTAAVDALQQCVEHASLLRPLRWRARLGLFHPNSTMFRAYSFYLIITAPLKNVTNFTNGALALVRRSSAEEFYLFGVLNTSSGIDLYYKVSPHLSTVYL